MADIVTKGTFLSLPFYGLRDHHGWGGRKIVWTRGWVGLEYKIVSWTQQAFPAAVVACTWPVQGQVRQRSSRVWEGVHKSLPWAKELHTVNGPWGRESQFSLSMSLLIGQPLSSECPYTQNYVDNTNWSQRVIKLREDGGTSLCVHGVTSLCVHVLRPEINLGYFLYFCPYFLR